MQYNYFISYTYNFGHGTTKLTQDHKINYNDIERLSKELLPKENGWDSPVIILNYILLDSEDNA